MVVFDKNFDFRGGVCCRLEKIKGAYKTPLFVANRIIVAF